MKSVFYAGIALFIIGCGNELSPTETELSEPVESAVSPTEPAAESQLFETATLPYVETQKAGAIDQRRAVVQNPTATAAVLIDRAAATTRVP